MKLKMNKETKTLVIEDNGIGMNKEDLIQCLGTIANSGTKTFMQSLKEGTADMSLIGQFGVGFYSSYLVADNVKVYSKKSGEECYVWESDAGGSFTISEFSDDTMLVDGGTRIELTMKEDCLEYLEEHKMRSIIKDHCQYLTHPIMLHTTRTEKKEEVVEEEVVEEIDGDMLDKKDAPKDEDDDVPKDESSTDDVPKDESSTDDVPKDE